MRSPANAARNDGYEEEDINTGNDRVPQETTTSTPRPLVHPAPVDAIPESTWRVYWRWGLAGVEHTRRFTQKNQCIRSQEGTVSYVPEGHATRARRSIVDFPYPPFFRNLMEAEVRSPS